MAALDVLEPEPPDPANPLLALEQVISTGHSAFFSPRALAESWARPIDEVARVIRGEWPKAIVNPQAKDKYSANWGKPVT